jgi:putative transposase
MPGRGVPLITDELYHVYNRGSDKRDIFLATKDFKRFLQSFYYYQFSDPKISFSHFSKNKMKTLNPLSSNKHIVIIGYALMPNHYHFLVKQIKDNGLSTFISQLSNSYTKYFNTKRQRIGPLFQGTFKAVRVESDEHLVHLSRYIHLNPVVSGLVKKPENYPWTSYLEYINGTKNFCDPKLVMDFFPDKKKYQQFTEDQISYGKSLEMLKHSKMDDY